MNWYHRGEERYVEYGSSFPATRAFGVVRSLYDTVYNMNMAHLTPGAQDGLRAPRRRRAAHRLHHLPDLPRPHAARPVRRERLPAGSPRRPSSATPVYGRRASSSTPTCSTRATPAARRRSACPASATSTPAASGAYLVENDLFDFLLFSLPDNDTYSHKRGPDAPGRARSPRPTARSSGSCTWPAARTRSSRSTR